MTAYDGLADLLSGRRPAGVYRWHALVTPREARDEVEAAGWRWGHLGGWAATGRAAFLDGVGRALAFPEWYGANLDALWDCLGDLPGPTLLVWDHWARLARGDQTGFEVGLRVLRDRSERDGAPPFAALLWGEGPPTGVASLD